MENWNIATIPTHSLKDSDWVDVIARIRNNETGEIREHLCHEIMNHGAEHPNTFNWEHNNFSCDCNRKIFFERSIGVELEDDDKEDCSDGKFSVQLVNPVDQKVYYGEF